MNIKGLNIKACIFDLDGTILESCSVWSDVDDHFFHKRGMEIPSGYSKAITALGFEESAVYTKNTYHLEDSVEDILKEWMDDVEEEYKNVVPIKANAKALLDHLKENNIPMAVATANTKSCYEPCLKRLDLYKYFDFVLDVKTIKGGKNSPEIFLTCAERFGIKPENILVFEDSLIAINTAKSAKFKTCAVFEKTCRDEEHKNKSADIYIIDFKELL
jgi:HAD superfamily hydrolase (TIGR01509 family)